MKKYIFFGLILFTSCSIHHEYIVNNNLLLTWTKEKENEAVNSLPFTAIFDDKQTKLYFIASLHQNSVDSLTFKLINKAFQECDPQILIIEGLEREKGYSYQRFVDIVNKSKNIENLGEPFYAVSLAQKRNIPFVGAEPTDKFILSQLFQYGYTVNDFVGFIVVRQIPEWKRRNELKGNNFNSLFNELLTITAKNLSVNRKTLFLKNEFITWFKKKLNTNFDINKIDTNLCAPYSDKDAIYTQKINFVINKIRNIYISQVIADNLNKYNRVLVVYGGSHYFQLKEILVNMLEKPIITIS